MRKINEHDNHEYFCDGCGIQLSCMSAEYLERHSIQDVSMYACIACGSEKQYCKNCAQSVYGNAKNNLGFRNAYICKKHCEENSKIVENIRFIFNQTSEFVKCQQLEVMPLIDSLDKTERKDLHEKCDLKIDSHLKIEDTRKEIISKIISRRIRRKTLSELPDYWEIKNFMNMVYGGHEKERTFEDVLKAIKLLDL